MRVGRFNPQPFDKAEKEGKAELTGTDRATVLGKLRLLPDEEQLKALRSYGFDAEAADLEYRMAQAHLAEIAESPAPVIEEAPIQEEAVEPEPVPEPKRVKKQRKSNKKK